MTDTYEIFISKCRALCSELGALGFRLELRYKRLTVELSDLDGELPLKGVRGITAIFSFDGFDFMMTYDKHPTLGILPGVMYMCVRFDLDLYGMRVLSYDLAPHLSTRGRDLGCAMFSYVSCEEKLCAAMAVFAAYFERYREELADIALDGERRDGVLADVRGAVEGYYGVGIFEESDRRAYDSLIENYRSFQILRYMQGAYSYFLRGKLKKSAKTYKRYKNRSSYENMILQYLSESSGALGYDPYLEYDRAAGASLKGLSETGEKFVSHFELAAFFFGYFIGIPLFTLPYVALYYIFARIGVDGAVFYSALEPYNVAFAVIPAIFTAIPFSFYVRGVAYKLFFRKKYQKIVDTEALTVTDGTRKFIKVMLNIILVLSISMTVLIANCGVAVTERGVVDKSGFFDLRGRIYEWDSINSVWLIEGRINGLDEWLDSPSYVLLLKDGTTLDLYQYTEQEDAEIKVAPTLVEYCGEIRKCRSIDEVRLASDGG